jgi:hypothetical protein
MALGVVLAEVLREKVDRHLRVDSGVGLLVLLEIQVRQQVNEVRLSIETQDSLGCSRFSPPCRPKSSRARSTRAAQRGDIAQAQALPMPR